MPRKPIQSNHIHGTSRSKNGGRPQSGIRSWFVPIYKNNKLPERERNKLDNIYGYRCPFGACCMSIHGIKLDNLCNHVLNCKYFPKSKKGICYPYISSLHSINKCTINFYLYSLNKYTMRCSSCIAIKFNVYCSCMIIQNWGIQILSFC